MKSLITNWAQWTLVLAAVILLAAMQRLDLLAVIAPLAIAVSYAITLANRDTDSGRRRI
ncbi:MAG TPA: hypothetical protein VIL63_03925 [Terriglobales bacterium]